jgi:hypothetical protein
MKINISPVALLLGIAILIPLLRAEVDSEHCSQEKAGTFEEIKKTASEDIKGVMEDLNNKDTDTDHKPFLNQLIDNDKAIVAASDAGVGAAKAGDKKGVQSAEDKVEELRDANQVIQIRREAAREIKEASRNAGNDPILKQLSTEMEKVYGELAAKQEASQKLQRECTLIRRQIEALHRKQRIAELEREKKQLEAQ